MKKKSKSTRMIEINSLSGGKTSSYLASKHKVDANVFALICCDDKRLKPRDNQIIQMVNDKLEKNGCISKYGEFISTLEDDKILKVMFDLEQKIGSSIDWVRHQSFDWWIRSKKILPNKSMRYCTTEMKIIPICEWVVSNYILKGKGRVLMNQGIRFDEQERRKTGEDVNYKNKIITGKSKNGNQNKWTSFDWAVAGYPLIEDKISHYQIQEFWKDSSIVFPKDSNCVGCFWKPTQQLRKNWDEQGRKMEWFSNKEKEIGGTFKTGISYSQIQKVGLQMDFHFGTGSGCQSGFCND